ncbi:MAG: hypothetical protein ACJA07_001466 [Rhodococcus sp. (in: high G+C Gram-positive bacteria)]|jgi:hypothetical protein
MGVLTLETPTSCALDADFPRGLVSLIAPLPLGLQIRLVSAVAVTLIDTVDRERRRRIAELNLEQRGKKSWHLPPVKLTPAGRPVATVPCWPGRQAWLRDVATALDTDSATRIRQSNAKVAAATVLAVATAHAHFAETRTGRHMVASLATLAKRAELSIDQVRRGRRVLRTLGLLVDLQLGRRLTGIEIQAARDLHGHTQTGAASEIALTTPARIAALRPKPAHRSLTHPSAPLSPLGFFSGSELAKNRRTQRKKRATTNQTTTPRPISLQRVTAELVSKSRGLDQTAKYLKKTCHLDAARPSTAPVRHLGALCDVIAAAGIDTERFTAQHIKDALDLDGRRNGLSWPDRIANPAKYLAWRLGRLDWTGPTPAERATADREQAQLALRAATTPSGPAASAEQRALAKQQLAAAILRNKRRRIAVEVP